MGFAGGEEDLFAFHHVHKTDRHPDDQRGPQPGLDLFGDGQKGCGGIANGQNGTRMLLRGPVHGGHSTGGPGGLGGGGDLRVGHVAERRAAHFGKAGPCDAGQRHVRVGDDGRPGPQGGDSGGDGARREAQIPGVIEIRRGVDDPLDYRSRFRRRGQAQRFQLGGDDGKARPLDVGGEMMLRCHVRLLPFRPIAA